MRSLAPVARIACRQALRSPWRSGLVIAMVAIPIAALTIGSVIIRTTIPTDQERVTEALGTADFSLHRQPGLSTEKLLASLPTGSKIVTEGELPQVVPIVEENRQIFVSFFEYDSPIDRSPLEGRFVVLTGRPAAHPGEVALHPEALDGFGADVGDVISPQSTLSLQVTGTVALAGDLSEPIGVLGEGTLAAHDYDSKSGWLVDLPPGARLEDAGPLISKLTRRQGPPYDAGQVLAGTANDQEIAAGGAFGGTTLLLLGTALIIGAAFAIGARRRLRTLGMLGAIGAEPRHVRATVLFEGILLGLVGSGVGVGLGIIGALIVHPHLSRLSGRVVGAVEIPILPLIGALGLGTLASGLAAWGPARSMEKLSILEALSLRPHTPRRPGRLAAAGILGTVVGSATVMWGAALGSDLVSTAGLILVTTGLLVGIPLLVSWTGRLAARLPTAARIATREVSRNGRRAGTAIAAAAVAVAVPIAVATVTLSDEASRRRVPPMAPDQLIVGGVSDDAPVVEAVQRVERALTDLVPDAIVTPIVPAVAVRGNRNELVYVECRRLVSRTGPSCGLLPLLIGSTDLLRAFHAEDGIEAFGDGEIIGLGSGAIPGNVVNLIRETKQSDEPYLEALPASAAGQASYSAVGLDEQNFAISHEQAEDLQLRPSTLPEHRVRLLVRLPHDVDSERLLALREAIDEDQLVSLTSLQELDPPADLPRLVSAGAGVAGALAIVGVIVALLASESRRERAILVALGASPRSRRFVAGWNASVVGLLACVFGVAIGVAPAMMQLLASSDGYTIVFPWRMVAAVVVVVPFLAGVLGAIFSRQPGAAALLRPIA